MNSKKLFYFSMSLVIVALTKPVVAGGGMVIGEYCSSDGDCSVAIGNSKCDGSADACVCQTGYYQIDEYTCSQVLGDMAYGCLADCYCTDFVPHSICVNQTVCACEDGYYEKNKNTCVAGPTIASSQGQHCTCRNAGNSCSPTVILTIVFLSLAVLFRV